MVNNCWQVFWYCLLRNTLLLPCSHASLFLACNPAPSTCTAVKALVQKISPWISHSVREGGWWARSGNLFGRWSWTGCWYDCCRCMTSVLLAWRGSWELVHWNARQTHGLDRAGLWRENVQAAVTFREHVACISSRVESPSACRTQILICLCTLHFLIFLNRVGKGQERKAAQWVRWKSKHRKLCYTHGSNFCSSYTNTPNHIYIWNIRKRSGQFYVGTDFYIKAETRQSTLQSWEGLYGGTLEILKSDSLYFPSEQISHFTELIFAVLICSNLFFPLLLPKSVPLVFLLNVNL